MCTQLPAHFYGVDVPNTCMLSCSCLGTLAYSLLTVYSESSPYTRRLWSTEPTISFVAGLFHVQDRTELKPCKQMQSCLELGAAKHKQFSSIQPLRWTSPRCFQPRMHVTQNRPFLREPLFLGLHYDSHEAYTWQMSVQAQILQAGPCHLCRGKYIIPSRHEPQA